MLVLSCSSVWIPGAMKYGFGLSSPHTHAHLNNMRTIAAGILLSLCLGSTAWAQLPDLIANAFTIRETNLRVGNTLQLSFRIKNQGTSSAAACRARVFISSNTSMVNAQLLSELSLPALAPQEETNAIDYIFSIPYNTTAGSKTVILRLDATNLVTEQNEANDFFPSNTLTILPNSSVEQHLPYPILLIHGLGSDYRTWDSLRNNLLNRFGWSYGGNMNFCLNQDGNNATANRLTDYRDWADTAALLPADFYTLNFNVGINGQDVSATNPAVQSNQAAITKQGLAVRDAIKHILRKTGRDKVILLGHSMGGLASREYLQNASNWQADGTHRVAKLATLGTPHGGSNTSGWGLSGLAGIDERSEAVRDLRFDYFYSGSPGVYLFGGIESNSVMANFLFNNYYNIDVNTNGLIDATPVVGLNQKTIPADLAYANLIGNGSILGGDGVVDAARANINNYYPLGADTFMILSSSAFLHVDLLNRMDFIHKTIDEPGKPALAYQVDTGRYYFGQFTEQPRLAVQASDSDYYKFPAYENGELSLTLTNLPLSQASITVSDSTGAVVAHRNSQGSSSITFQQLPVRAGIYSVLIAGLADGTSWQSPYAWKASVSELGICSGTSRHYDAGMAGNTYQWEVNTGSGFTPVSNSTIYNGANSRTLQINQPPTNWYGYRYRCRVNGSMLSAESTLKFSARWIGLSDDRWENPSNWSCGVVPDAKTDVYVYAGAPHPPTIRNTVSCRALYLRSGSTVTVQVNAALQVLGD